jgi:hypothetical protein
MHEYIISGPVLYRKRMEYIERKRKKDIKRANSKRER